MDLKEALSKLQKGKPLSDDELFILEKHFSDLIGLLLPHGDRTALIRSALHIELYSVKSFIEARGLN